MQSRYNLLDIEAFASRYYVNPATGTPAKLLITPYEYPITFANLATLTTQTANINISAVADFVITGFSHRAVLDDEAQTISDKPAPQCEILVTDSGSGEQYMNVATDIENYSTSGMFLRELPYPRIVSGKSSLNVQVRNYGAETYGILKLTLQGVQVRAFQQ